MLFPHENDKSTQKLKYDPQKSIHAKYFKLD